MTDRSLYNAQPAIVSGVNENVESLTLVLSTYAHGTTKTGLTIKTKGIHTPSPLRAIGCSLIDCFRILTLNAARARCHHW